MIEPKEHGDTFISCEYERNFESLRWMRDIPWLNFPSDWMVKIVPPFRGAIIRFRVHRKGANSDKSISIYFDAYNNLGYEDGPYWEIYPHKDCTARFMMGEEDEMLKEIEESLKELEKSDE